MPVPAGVTLRGKTIASSGNPTWDGVGLSVMMGNGRSITVKAPPDMALVITEQKLKKTKVERRIGAVPQLAALEVVPVETDPDYVPSPGKPPTQYIIGPTRTSTVQGFKEAFPGGIAYEQMKFSESRAPLSREDKGPAGQIVLKKTTENYATRVTLIGIIPVPSEQDIKAAKENAAAQKAREALLAQRETTAIDIGDLRSTRLADIDGWMSDAQSKIGTMGRSDIPKADSVVSEITNAISSLSQANSNGRVPSLPLFTGGALPPFPLFSGGALPFLTLPPLFPMARGGQVGSATSQVANLTSLQSQATSLRDQMKDELDAADEFYSALQGNRSDVATAKDKPGIETNYAQAKSNYNNIAQIASKVHGEAADITSYRDSAKSSYNSGIASIGGEIQRATDIKAAQKLEDDSRDVEQRLKDEAAKERNEREQAAAAALLATRQRMADEKAAAAARAAEEQAKQDEAIRNAQEKARQDQAARQAEAQKKIDERRQKLDSVSAEAARIRQEAARRKLKRK
jgi:hypothetical protein